MPQWVNFRELRQNLLFANVLRHYGIEIKTTKPNQHVGLCPLPNHGGKRESPCFSANLEKNIFQCFGCKAKGNALDFCALMLGLDPSNGEQLRQAALTVQEKLFGIVQAGATEKKDTPPIAKKDAEPSAPSKPTEINTPLDFTLKALDATHPYLKERKFTAETIQMFGLGFCKRGSLKDRIAIPLHDHLGRLVGYAGRLVDDKAVTDDNPKYRLPTAREREGVVLEFRKSEFLYNGHRIKGPLENLIVVEGFPALWWLVQAGFGNSVALMGSSCSEKQAELVISLLLPQGCCWILTDGNDAGDKGAAEIFEKVGSRRYVRRIRLESGRQPTDCEPTELADLLADCKSMVPARKSGRSTKMRLMTKEVRRQHAIVELIQWFPSLQDCIITAAKWDADIFDEAACQFQGGKRLAAQFVLAVWKQERDWKSGIFNVAQAMDVWDSAHCRAFLWWATDPW